MKVSDVRQYALSLPEVIEQPHFKFTSFRIRGKIFATVPPEGGYVHVFVDEQRRELATTMFPEFCEKLWWGKKVVGVRVSLQHADSGAVSELLLAAYKRKAPKRLVKAQNGDAVD